MGQLIVILIIIYIIINYWCVGLIIVVAYLIYVVRKHKEPNISVEIKIGKIGNRHGTLDISMKDGNLQFFAYNPSDMRISGVLSISTVAEFKTMLNVVSEQFYKTPTQSTNTTVEIKLCKIGAQNGGTLNFSLITEKDKKYIRLYAFYKKDLRKSGVIIHVEITDLEIILRQIDMQSEHK